MISVVLYEHDMLLDKPCDFVTDMRPLYRSFAILFEAPMTSWAINYMPEYVDIESLLDHIIYDIEINYDIYEEFHWTEEDAMDYIETSWEYISYLLEEAIPSVEMQAREQGLCAIDSMSLTPNFESVTYSVHPQVFVLEEDDRHLGVYMPKEHVSKVISIEEASRERLEARLKIRFAEKARERGFLSE